MTGKARLSLQLTDIAEWEGDVVDLCRIDLGDIEGEAAEQAALYAYFAQVAATAKAEVDSAKEKIRVAEAHAFAEIQAALTEERGKAPAIAELERHLSTHPEVERSREAERLAALRLERLRGVTEALRQRKDMIVTIASNYRSGVEIPSGEAAAPAAMSEYRRKRERAAEARRERDETKPA